MIPIDGKKISLEIEQELKDTLQKMDVRKKKPGLAFILVGENPASLTYVNAKKKACSRIGIESTVIQFPNQISESDLLRKIEEFNQNRNIHGILVQLPLPSHINAFCVTQTIDPKKDVDGFHPLNLGKLLLGEESGFYPCTPFGIQTLLERSHISTEGKKVVIAGRSNIVGKPLAALLMQKKKGANATVTVVHSKSEHFQKITLSADILICAMGKPKYIKKEMVRSQAVVIDVGINRLQTGKIVGDVDYDEVSQVASHITPVPGGVGPMTIAMLLKNTILSFERNHG